MFQEAFDGRHFEQVSRVCSQSFQLQRCLSAKTTVNAKKNGEDPLLKKLFLEKLAEFQKTKPPMSDAISKQYKDDIERLNGVYIMEPTKRTSHSFLNSTK